MYSPLFGVIAAGQNLVTEPSEAPSPTSFLYSLSPNKPFAHIVVFLLPGIVLPTDTAAGIYLSTASDVAAATASGRTPDFKFLGGVGPGKESAVFKVADSATASASLVLGISIEDAASVAARMQELSVNGSIAKTAASASQESQVVLAQKIIKNAFNFLSSFSGNLGPGGVEVVPLKAFEGWWQKFESRIRLDPDFLNKQTD